jgi:hypothetical protein
MADVVEVGELLVAGSVDSKAQLLDKINIATATTHSTKTTSIRILGLIIIILYYALFTNMQ